VNSGTKWKLYLKRLKQVLSELGGELGVSVMKRVMMVRWHSTTRMKTNPEFCSRQVIKSTRIISKGYKD